MTQDLKTPMPPAVAAPTASGRRLLAQLVEHAFREGWRTSEDFIKHFPAHTIMAALKSAPELRVAILAAATGIYEEILRRKSPALAAEDLRVALEEGTTTSQELLQVFPPEDRVRYLDAHRIWDFLAEDRFWEIDPEAGEEQRRGAIDRMIFTLTQALQERLITLRDILDGLTYDAVADSLSPQELRLVVRHALVKGRENIGLNEKVLLEVLPLDKLLRSVSLEHVWHEVVIRRLAVPSGLTELSREERRTSQADKRGPSERRRWPSRPPPAAPAEPSRPFADHQVTAPPPYDADEAYAQSREPYVQTQYDEDADDVLTAVPPPAALRESSLSPPPPSAPRAAGSPLTSPIGSPPLGFAPAQFSPPPGPPGVRELESAAAQPTLSSQQSPMALPLPPPGTSRTMVGVGFEPPSADAERQRQRVTEHLRAIGRLPPNHATLPAAVLRSIDAMYALLPSATDDIQRKSVIRQAFGNENYLRIALLGLIELMDSSVDTSDPVIQEAKIEALVKILLFEEQRRKETGRFAPSQFGGSRGPGSARGVSSAPPSSGASGGYYYPPPAAPASYPLNPAAVPPHVPTERPPPPVLTAVPGYNPTAAPPLPNLPADPTQTRRRTVPPPLPPTYPRG